MHILTNLLTRRRSCIALRVSSHRPSARSLFTTRFARLCVSPSQPASAVTTLAQHMAAPGGDSAAAAAAAGNMPADSLSPSTQPLTFAAFLDKMRQPAAADLVRAIKAFLTEMLTSSPNADADAHRVQVRCRTDGALFATWARLLSPAFLWTRSLS